MGEPTWTREKLQLLVHREIGDYKLIVVSNRQPYVHDLIGGELSYASPAGGVTKSPRTIPPIPSSWSGSPSINSRDTTTVSPTKAYGHCAITRS